MTQYKEGNRLTAIPLDGTPFFNTGRLFKVEGGCLRRFYDVTQRWARACSPMDFERPFYAAVEINQESGDARKGGEG